MFPSKAFVGAEFKYVISRDSFLGKSKWPELSHYRLQQVHILIRLQCVPFNMTPSTAAVTRCPVGCMLSDRNAGLRGLIKETPVVSRQKYRKRCSVCERMTSAMTCKGCGIQRSWPNRSRHYYPRIFVEELRKNTKNFSQDIRCPDRNSNWGPHVEFSYIHDETIIRVENLPWRRWYTRLHGSIRHKHYSLSSYQSQLLNKCLLIYVSNFETCSSFRREPTDRNLK